jgi:hypothetical protein
MVLVSNDSTAAARENKYAKIDQAAGETQFIRYALVDNFNDKAFAAAFEKYWAEKEAASRKPKETRKQERARLRKARQEKVREAKYIRKKGHAVGIDKIVMVNPWFAKLDKRKKTPVQHVASESAEIALSNQILQNANIAKLDVELLGDYSFKGPDAEKFNDYAFLKSWMNERPKHMDGDADGQQPRQRTGAGAGCQVRHAVLLLVGAGGRAGTQKGRGLPSFAYSLLLYPLLPYAIYYAAYAQVQYLLLLPGIRPHHGQARFSPTSSSSTGRDRRTCSIQRCTTLFTS